jgi:hypothetical protein
MVEVPEPGAGIELGLKLAVTPVGIPEADKLTELLNPPLTIVVSVDVPWFPCTMLTAVGEAERVKLGVTVAVTVRVTVVVC